MTPDQLKLFIRENERSTAEAIERTVNGKIRMMDEKLDAHIKVSQDFQDEVKPYLQGAAGLQLLWKVLVSIGSLALAWAAIKNFRL